MPSLSAARALPLSTLWLALAVACAGDKESSGGGDDGFTDGGADGTDGTTDGTDGADGTDGGTDGTDGGTDGTDGTDGGTDGTDGADGGTDGECVDVDGDASAPADASGCADAGGVCVWSDDMCTGSVVDLGGCAFDGGGAACCVPNIPAPEGETCAALGGTCAPVGGCLQAKGWLVQDDGGCSAEWGPSATCCAPTAACEGWGTELCCAYDSTGTAMTAYNPTCQRGEPACFEGTTQVCEADCRP